MGALQSLVRRLGSRRWVASVAAPVLGRMDTFVLRRGRQLTPFPTLLLETTGRHSGERHESPLWYIRDGGDYVVIATNFGRAEPDWSKNLHSDPSCRLQEGDAECDAHASLVGDDEWDRLFGRFAAFYPPYRDYLDRAGRPVPMWRLRVR